MFEVIYLIKNFPNEKHAPYQLQVSTSYQPRILNAIHKTISPEVAKDAM